MGTIRDLLMSFLGRPRRPKIQEGEVLSQLIASDVRRDIEVISTARIDEGVITGRVRTVNVLYVARGFVTVPDFGPPQELRIDEMWHWTGKGWGGLPDGTSIVDHVRERQPSDDSPPSS